MRKLYVNIEKVKIKKGGANMLATPITNIDAAIERLANETEKIKSIIVRYGATNQGQQYNNAASAVKELSVKLSTIALELNGFQHDIVKLQGKIKIFENDRTPSATPRKLYIQKVVVSVDTSIVEFVVSEMKKVSSALKDYSEQTTQTVKKLVSEKNALSSIWQDPQYRQIFSPYIDEVCSIINQYAGVLNSYKAELDGKIAAISNGG